MSSETCVKCGVGIGMLHKAGCLFAGTSYGADYGYADKYQVGGDHYKELAVQPWAAMQSWLTPAEFEGFLRGNAIKYLARAGRKDDGLQDLKKALHYIEKLVSVKEQEK